MLGLPFLDKTPAYDLRGKYSAIDISKYIVDKCSKEQRLISNLQLQKILYYIQKEFLQNEYKAVFYEEIEAWPFGPVVRESYYKFSGFGRLPIYYIWLDENPIEQQDMKVIDIIVEKKRNVDPWTMVDDTHKPGGAWDLTYRDGIGYKEVIPKEWIVVYG